MISKQKNKTFAERLLIVALSALSGLIILLTGSVIQKSFIGVPILDIKSYIIPIIYGAVTGALIGLLIMKVLVSKQIIRQEYENMHTILKSINDVIIATDINKKIICFNNAAERVMGISSKVALYQDLNHILKIHPTKKDAQIDITDKLSKGKYKESDNCYLQDRHGNFINIAYSAILINDEDNQFFGNIILIRDLSKENAYIETIKESEAKLKSILHSINDLIIVIDKDGHYREIAETNQELLIRPAEELTGKNIFEIFPRETAQKFQDAIDEAYNNDKTVNIEYSLEINTDNMWFSAKISKFKENHVILVIKDKTEQIEYENKLIKAKEKAEENDNLKSIFLSNLSHEIRTPVNGILGFSELLNEDDLEREEIAEYTKCISESSKRLLNTMTNLINISKIQSKSIELNIAKFSLNENLILYYDKYKESAAGKNILLTLSLPEEDCQIYSDNELLNIIMENLIDNAIKFTYEGSVEFGYEKKDSKIRFFVRDTGIGIDPNKDVFKNFEQANTDLYNEYEGIGIGLSICKGFADMINGELSYKSVINEGTEFELRLPCKLNK